MLITSQIERVTFALLEATLALLVLARLLYLVGVWPTCGRHGSDGGGGGGGGGWCAWSWSPDVVVERPSGAVATLRPSRRASCAWSWRHAGLVVVVLNCGVHVFNLLACPSPAGDPAIFDGIVDPDLFNGYWSFSSALSIAALGIVLRLFVEATAKFHAPTRRVLRALDIATATCSVFELFIILLPVSIQLNLSTAITVTFILSIFVGLSVYSVTTLSRLLRTTPPDTPLYRSTQKLLNAIRMFRYLLALVSAFLVLGLLLPSFIADKRSTTIYTNPCSWTQALLGNVIIAWVLGRMSATQPADGGSLAGAREPDDVSLLSRQLRVSAVKMRAPPVLSSSTAAVVFPMSTASGASSDAPAHSSFVTSPTAAMHMRTDTVTLPVSSSSSSTPVPTALTSPMGVDTDQLLLRPGPPRRAFE